MLVSPPASSETIYVHPDGDPSTTRYLWGDSVITNGVSVAEAITLARAANGSRPLEIRLLRRAETPDTSYSVDLASTEAALEWRGSETNRLIIRGQVDRSGSLPRPLTIIVGRRSLRQILCVPQGIDLCAAPPRDGPTSRRQDLLDFLSGELEAENGQKRAPAKPDIPLRLNCLLLWNAAFVEITDVGFVNAGSPLLRLTHRRISLCGARSSKGPLTPSPPSRSKVFPRAPTRSKLPETSGVKALRPTAHPLCLATSTRTGLAPSASGRTSPGPWSITIFGAH